MAKVPAGDWVPYVEAFVDVSRSPAQHSASVDALAALVNKDKLKLFDLVSKMDMYLTTTDHIVRSRGIMLLGEIMSQISFKWLDVNAITTLSDFFISRLSDWHALRGALVGCLALLQRKPSVGTIVIADVKRLVESFIDDVQVQSLAAADRKLCFEIICCVLDHYPEAVKTMPYIYQKIQRTKNSTYASTITRKGKTRPSATASAPPSPEKTRPHHPLTTTGESFEALKTGVVRRTATEPWTMNEQGQLSPGRKPAHHRHPNRAPTTDPPTNDHQTSAGRRTTQTPPAPYLRAPRHRWRRRRRDDKRARGRKPQQVRPRPPLRRTHRGTPTIKNTSFSRRPLPSPPWPAREAPSKKNVKTTKTQSTATQLVHPPPPRPAGEKKHHPPASTTRLPDRRIWEHQPPEARRLERSRGGRGAPARLFHDHGADSTPPAPPGHQPPLYTRLGHRSGAPPLPHRQNGGRRGKRPPDRPSARRGKRATSFSPLRTTVAGEGEKRRLACVLELTSSTLWGGWRH